MAHRLGTPVSDRHRAGARNTHRRYCARSNSGVLGQQRLSSPYEVRITITLPEEQAERLVALCREESISWAEVVRRAITRYLNEYRPEGRPETRAEPGEDAFGMWRGRQLDGLARERRLREEWT